MQATSPTIGAVAAPEPSTVHVVERMMPGGIETLVLDMMGGMPGRHTVFSLSGTREELQRAWPRLAALGSALEAFNRPSGVSPGLVGRLSSRLRALRPDVVIVHHIGPLIYGGLAARLAQVPVVLHVEHDAWHYQSPRRRQVAGLLFKLVRPRRVAVSNEIAAKVGGHFRAAKITVIPPGIDMDLYRPRDSNAARARLGLPVDVPVIGTSGRLAPVKAQIMLIEALARLQQRAEPARLPQVVIVGEGPERPALDARAAALGLKGAVHLLGHRDDLPEILPAFDVYCLPSLNEGLPRAVLEAQAVGLPVVASNVGALADAVCPASGRLVPPSDPAVLALALAEALARPIDPIIPRTFVETRYGLVKTLKAFEHLVNSTEAVHVRSDR